MLKIQVILGSTRPNRFSEKPGKWIVEELNKKEEIEGELIDLRDYFLPFYNEIMGPTGLKGNYTSEIAKKWAKKVEEADAYIIVAPEYNHGYPAVLKNALDYVYYEWNKKPVGFISYGGVGGGTRSVEQLRQVAIELQLVPIRTSIHMPLYSNFLDEKGNLKTEMLQSGADTMIQELIWWAKLLKPARVKTP